MGGVIMKENKISPIIIRKPELPKPAINMVTPFNLDPNVKARHKIGIYAKTLTYQSIDVDIDRNNGEVSLYIPDISEEIKAVHAMLYDLSNDREYHDRVSMDILFVDSTKDEYIRSAIIAKNCIPIEKIGNIEKMESKLSEEVKSGIRYLVRTTYTALIPLTFSCEIVDEIDGKSAVDIANDYMEGYMGYIKPREKNK
jgi:hypothetical protein